MPENSAAIGLLLLSLKTLSQRALLAVASLFVAATVGSVWWLFNNALPADPSPRQLIGLGLYCIFVLAIHIVGRKNAVDRERR